jgi:PQQ-dependent dehydrogenase (s-GDH family)
MRNMNTIENLDMKVTLIFVFLILICTCSQAQVKGPLGEQFNVRIVASKLSDPWSVVYGPDHFLWVTESKGYRVDRIDPKTGKQIVLLDLNKERHFPRYDQLGKRSGGKPWPQGGLVGLALHPQLLTGKPYVYLMYVYRFEGADSTSSGCRLHDGGCFFTGRIVRYKYERKKLTLTHPVVICDTIPQSSDHNGGRLTIAPINGRNYLFYSIGEMGAGQFTNIARRNNAQQTRVYEGKILRFNIEQDKDAGTYDKWIPNDNPFNGGAQSAVWSYGHRNPQGLAYGIVNGKGYLYESEHGPFSDDEVNIIEKGKNYGHPLVIGYADGNYDGLAAGVSNNLNGAGIWHTAYPLIISEKDNAKRIGPEYRDPLVTLYPNSHAFLSDLFAKLSKGDSDQHWPSEAPSSLAIYTSTAIPGWKNSLLLPTLKGGKLIRLKLKADGKQIEGDTICYFKGSERYRDIALSPDGRHIYMAVDSSAVSSGPSKANPKQVSYRGCIIEYTYIGQAPGEIDRKRTGVILNK